MLEEANNAVGNVLNRADVGTLNPAIDPLDTNALGGMVPGPKTEVGKVLKNADVGTLKRPDAFAINVPPETRTPVVV